jgi:predicted nucleotidyltransferase
MVAARPRRSSADELQQIVQRIVEIYVPDKIILFGSYAYGQPGPDSDCDLLIIKDSTARPIDRRGGYTPCLIRAILTFFRC